MARKRRRGAGAVLLTAFIAFEVVLMASIASGAAGSKTVSILTDAKPGAPVKHGLAKLTAALEAKGLTVQQSASPMETPGRKLIVAGLAGGTGPAARYLADSSVAPPPTAPESLVVRRIGFPEKGSLLLAGADDRGLMYALLDTADRVGWAADPAKPLSEVKDTAEKPYVVERAISAYTMHPSHFESTFHDPEYWARYLDTLAKNRFNSFALLFGYENGGYFAPPYPYFFDVEGFDDVGVVGYTKARQQKNLASLNRMIRMAHDRGINVTLGFWDHIYRGGVQGPTADAKKPTKGLVWGVGPENLAPYTKAALAKFLKLVPAVDALQFRMHGESGLKRDEMQTFWPDIYRIVQQARPGIRFDARAKNFPDNLIDKALDAGLNLRIATKYWCEQMGPPFHPTHIPRQNQHDRRHGYADLLRYPQRYKMHWRLWNSGTTRLLLWGDPDYVRRFAESTHLYGGEGFEVSEPLTTKMQDQPHDDPTFPLLAERYRYYDYELERYWHFFQVFGRLGYNPQTDPAVWEKEFQRRFGKEAAPFVEEALHKASQVLPRINACVFPYKHFPTTRGWPAMQPPGAKLEDYAKAGVGDTQQFLAMVEAAKLLLDRGESPKRWPRQSSTWFAAVGAKVLTLAAFAERAAGDRRTKEFHSTMVDLRILANLAMYHAHRLPAGVAFNLYQATGDVEALDAAIAGEEKAVAAWKAIGEAAGDVYDADLRFGRRSAGLSGHWRDVLPKLQDSLADLRRRRKDVRPTPKTAKPGSAMALMARSSADSVLPVVTHTPIETAPAGKPLKVTAKVEDPSGVKWVRLRYRIVNQTKDYETLEMRATGVPGEYAATVPGDALDPQWDFMYLIEAMDKVGNGVMWPDLETETPYVIVRLKRD